MNKKSTAFFIVFLILCLGLSGCTEQNDSNGIDDTEKFFGTWNTSDPIQWYIKPSFTFFENGSFIVQNYGGTFIASNGKLELHWEDGENIYIYSYVFLDDNTLSLTYLETQDNGIYKRQ